MNILRASWLAIPALLVAAMPAVAQQPGNTEPQSIFGEQIEVRVVNVEAVVIDRDGNRVQGLKPEDFRLKVDGKIVPVEYFNEVRSGQAIALADATETSPVKGLPSLAPGTSVGTSYLVFIDDFFSVATRRNQVLKSLKDQLSRLGPEDRMAIVVYDGSQIDMLSSWSGSVRQLGQAIEQAIGRPSKGLARMAELRSFESSRRLGGGPIFEPSSSSAFAQRLDIEELEFADSLTAQTEHAVAAAASALRGFASPPGRKVMLLLAGGWPHSPVDYVVNNPNRPILSGDLPRGDKIFHPLVDTANRLGYTIYPVDVPGVESSVADASLVSPSRGGIDIREQEHQASLLFVAAETGGKALLNSLAEAALENVESDTRSYYWLGFTPSWQGNDKRHQVNVEVVRPGLRIRFRDSFLDLSRKAEVSMMVESAMLFGGSPDSAPLPFKLGQPVNSGRREMEVPISLAVPVEAVTFVPVGGKWAAEIELRVSAVDANGGRAPVPMVPLTLTTDTEPKPGTAVRYDTRVKLRRVANHLRLAVYDPLSGRILTGQAEVAPPKK